jgi:uncharacterized membrane protein YccC
MRTQSLALVCRARAPRPMCVGSASHRSATGVCVLLLLSPLFFFFFFLFDTPKKNPTLTLIGTLTCVFFCLFLCVSYRFFFFFLAE